MLKGSLYWVLILGLYWVYIPKGNSTLLVPLVTRFFIHEREEWDSDRVE